MTLLVPFLNQDDIILTYSIETFNATKGADFVMQPYFDPTGRNMNIWRNFNPKGEGRIGN